MDSDYYYSKGQYASGQSDQAVNLMSTYFGGSNPSLAHITVAIHEADCKSAGVIKSWWSAVLVRFKRDRIFTFW